MDEILVHVSTPATRRNDELFRNLAKAYYDFEPFELPVQNSDTRGQTQELLGPEFSNTISTTPGPAQALTDSLSLSWVSSADIDAQPDGGARNRELHIAQHSFPSTIDCTQLTFGIEQPERNQTGWKGISDGSMKKSQSEAHVDSTFIGSHEIGYIEDSQLAAAALESQLDGQLSSAEDEISEDDSVQRKSSQSPPSEEDSPNCGGTLDSNGLKEIFAPEQGENFDYVEVAHTAATSRSFNFNSIPTEVYAPFPEISINAPNSLPSQITAYLSNVKKKHEGRFKPSKITRNLTNDERGHWLVECSEWPLDTQYQFWRRTSEHIRQGRLGWGVSMHRNAAPNSLGRISLYCWGECAEHIWLSLWSCSGGELVHTRSSWLDAGEDIIIRYI
ncbi:hypothetical protein BU24DRAFT_424256 [Aaosphaeria arxii CBS 175.79]|uniref:Uncharacterized protein n=1 Tax=Aaosphaeria arxii CBS 175.79 TaxID=1450172 RepID=A0A6A5XJX3_9PLEO|nr:uncharacterized protein BU24DRAFT_424256 [Aaosphaeria arxii CBS 175.79]KAF2013253.1 hypothetical protein BU24DRAFT_424256 [Aaosphaeria arxii CBS 175.79]